MKRISRIHQSPEEVWRHLHRSATLARTPRSQEAAKEYVQAITDRADVAFSADAFGNMRVSRSGQAPDSRIAPMFVQAHFGGLASCVDQKTARESDTSLESRHAWLGSAVSLALLTESLRPKGRLSFF